MAIKLAATLRDRTYNGTAGNLSKAHGKAEFSADAADTIVHTLDMDAGFKLFGLSAIRTAMGAGTGLQVGVHYPDGDGTDDPDYFGTVADSSSAGTLTWAGSPVVFDKRVILTVTVTDAAGTGAVDVIPEYVYVGKL